MKAKRMVHRAEHKSFSPCAVRFALLYFTNNMRRTSL